MSVPLTSGSIVRPDKSDPVDLVKGPPSTFGGSIGGWSAAGSGTTATYDGAVGVDATHGSLKMHSTAAATDRYVELSLPGTFVSGQVYHAAFLMKLDALGSNEDVHYQVAFGDRVTPDITTSEVIFRKADSTGSDRGLPELRFSWMLIAWKPTGNRTGVTLRIQRAAAGSGSTHDLWIAQARFVNVPTGNIGLLRQSLVEPTYPLYGMQLMPYSDDVYGGFGLATAGFPGIMGFVWGSSSVYMQGPPTPLGDQSYISMGSFGPEAYGAQLNGDARRATTTWNEEFGPNYPGWNRGSRSSTEVEFWPDGDYDLYLLDGASNAHTKHWWHEEADGAYKASAGRKSRIGLYFEKTFNVTGAQTTGTAKNEFAQYFQLPYPAEIDEVRVHLNTVPTGSTFIVDVNINGTTIFTTQANRPTVAISASDATSGAPDTTKFSKNDRLSFDIDQVGSTIAGSDLMVQVRGRYLW